MADLGALDALIARSTRTATPSVADSIAFPARQMTAAELVAFWRDARMMAMVTVGAGGQPHVASVHSDLDGTTLRLVVYEHAVRRFGPVATLVEWDAATPPFATVAAEVAHARAIMQREQGGAVAA